MTVFDRSREPIACTVKTWTFLRVYLETITHVFPAHLTDSAQCSVLFFFFFRFYIVSPVLYPSAGAVLNDTLKGKAAH